jgi:hypothetical protein
LEEDSDEMSDNELDTISFGNWRDMLYANAVDLGFLDELICRSSSCQLCALIIDTATRINHGEELPTKDKGERIKYLLQKDLFCMLCNVLYGGKFRGRLDINRLKVTLDPSIHLPVSKNWVKATFQPYSGPTTGMEAKDLVGLGREMGTCGTRGI